MKLRPEGLLLVDKPTGPTSHDIVSWVRRATGQRRIGHTGTLDPAAAGLLILALGNATRLIRFVPAAPKSYEGTIAFGIRTDTDDLAGNIVERSDSPLPNFESIAVAARAFLGRQDQVPPTVSARKVAGQRLYRLARQGRPTTAPATEIEVLRFDLKQGAQADRVEFQAAVSTGTYIRSMARDLGAALGCGAALASLQRTAIGPFRLENAIDPPERGLRDWLPEALIPLDRIPLTAPPLHLFGVDEARRFRSGCQVAAAELEDGWARVLDAEDHLLGLGEVTTGLLKPRVVLSAKAD